MISTHLESKVQLNTLNIAYLIDRFSEGASPPIPPVKNIVDVTDDKTVFYQSVALT